MLLDLYKGIQKACIELHEIESHLKAIGVRIEEKEQVGTLIHANSLYVVKCAKVSTVSRMTLPWLA